MKYREPIQEGTLLHEADSILKSVFESNDEKDLENLTQSFIKLLNKKGGFDVLQDSNIKDRFESLKLSGKNVSFVVEVLQVIIDLGKDDLHERVEGAITTVNAAVHAGVEIQKGNATTEFGIEGNINNEYGLKLENFGKNLHNAGWIDVTEIFRENGEIIIKYRGRIVANLPTKLNPEYQGKNRRELFVEGVAEHLLTETDFQGIIDWLKKVGVDNIALQASFFIDVIGLDEGNYLCRDLIEGESCYAFHLAKEDCFISLVNINSANNNFKALTR